MRNGAALRRNFPAHILVMCAGAVMATGCSDGPTANTPPRLALSTVGRLERGVTIQLVAKHDTTTVAPATLTYSANPAASVQFNTDGSVKLLATGHVSLIAATSPTSADTLGVDVAAPPTILLDRVASGVRAIYRASLDGVDTVRISHGIHDDVMASTARDSVVFVSFRDGNAELYAVSASGGTEKRLTTTATDESSPSLSPVNASLAYISNVSGLDRLWKSASDGTGAAPATQALASDIQENPRWSPTGDRVLFVATTFGSATLFVMRASTGEITPFISGNPTAVDPAWSFDGGTVAYVSPRTDGSGPGVYLYSTSKATSSLLVAGTDVGQPTFLRDGRVVFTRFAGGASKLQWVDPAAPTTVHDIALTGSPAHAVAP